MRRNGTLALVVVLAACTGHKTAQVIDLDGGSADDGGAPAISIESPKANVRFLNAPRMQRSFARALGLPLDFCKELGLHSCFDLVHKISLLGTEPYQLGVDDPLPGTGASTPLVVERVALAGCVTRVTIDLAPAAPAMSQVASSARIFHRLKPDAQGRIDVAQPAVAEAIDALYTRRLQRHATATEIEHLRQLYRDVEASSSSKPAADWAVASCVAVLTSMESLFY